MDGVEICRGTQGFCRLLHACLLHIGFMELSTRSKEKILSCSFNIMLMESRWRWQHQHLKYMFSFFLNNFFLKSNIFLGKSHAPQVACSIPKMTVSSQKLTMTVKTNVSTQLPAPLCKWLRGEVSKKPDNKVKKAHGNHDATAKLGGESAGAGC